jgi:hypothetical protein
MELAHSKDDGAIKVVLTFAPVGRDVATPAEARAMLGLETGRG